VVGDEQRRQAGRVERLIQPVAVALHARFVEIHEHHAFVNLNDAVLESGADVEFLQLHGEDEIRQDRLGNVHAEELHQRTDGGGDDGARTGQPDAHRDVGVILDGEIAVQRSAGAAAPVAEFLDGGLDEADAPVIAVLADVFQKIIHAEKLQPVAVAARNAKARGLVQRHLGAKIPHDKRNGLAVIAVARIADQAGAGVGTGADHGYQHSIAVRICGRAARRPALS